MSNKRTSNKLLLGLIAAIIISLTIILVWLFLNNGREVRTHINSNTTSSYIECESKEPKDAFFSSILSKDSNQKIKITFDEKSIDKIAYTYTGTFNDSEVAKEESGRMTFEYNTYMGQHTDYDRSVLSPAFSAVEGKLVINIFMDEKYFDDNTAKLVFLAPDEYLEIARNEKNNDLSMMINRIYESKGFICEIKE